jgi:hypothetical protein
VALLSKSAAGKERRSHFSREAFFKVSPTACTSPIPAEFAERICYLRDLLEMCSNGAWGWQLRQSIPPVSLRESIDALVEIGWIEVSMR